MNPTAAATATASPLPEDFYAQRRRIINEVKLLDNKHYQVKVLDLLTDNRRLNNYSLSKKGCLIIMDHPHITKNILSKVSRLTKEFHNRKKLVERNETKRDNIIKKFSQKMVSD